MLIRSGKSRLCTSTRNPLGHNRNKVLFERLFWLSNRSVEKHFFCNHCNRKPLRPHWRRSHHYNVQQYRGYEGVVVCGVVREPRVPRTVYRSPTGSATCRHRSVACAHNSRRAVLQTTATSKTSNDSNVGCSRPLATAAEEGLSAGNSSSDCNLPPRYVGPYSFRSLVLTGGHWLPPPATATDVQLNQNSPIDLGSSCSTLIFKSLNFQKPRFLKKYVAPVSTTTITSIYNVHVLMQLVTNFIGQWRI